MLVSLAFSLKQFVAVYDFAPSPGKHGRLELPFLTGERIHVYGEERADGFYYGEVNRIVFILEVKTVFVL